MGGETVDATRSRAIAGCERVCGRCNKNTRGGKGAGGITSREAKNPTTVTRRCGGNAGLVAPVLKTGMVFSSRNDVCHGTRCHGQHTKCVTGDTVVASVIKEVNKTGYQCGG